MLPPFIKDKEVQQVIHDTYSTMSDIVSSSGQDEGSCGQYALCLNIQYNFARYGVEIFNTVASQQSLWRYIIKPMIKGGDCSSVFPECVE